MDAVPQSFAKRLDHFVRWFFTVSPTEVVEIAPIAKAQVFRRAASRRPPPRLRAHHSGPVRVSVEAK